MDSIRSVGATIESSITDAAFDFIEVAYVLAQTVQLVQATDFRIVASEAEIVLDRRSTARGIRQSDAFLVVFLVPGGLFSGHFEQSKKIGNKADSLPILTRIS